MTSRWSVRRLVVLVAVLLMVLGGGSVVARKIWGSTTCGAERVDDPISPLQSAATMAQRPDEDRDRIATAIDAMGAPFGPVVAGIDYYYDQFLRLYGVPDGALAWTKNNAPVTYLDDATLAPRWSLRPTAKRTAWDVSADRFLLLNLADKDPVTIAQFDLRSGQGRWCVEVATKHHDGEPVATTFLDDGDVVAALPSGTEVRLTRLAGRNGDPRWSRSLATADRADYLGAFTDHLLVIGGSEESRLTDPALVSGAIASMVTAVDTSTGDPRWTWGGGPGTTLHVVGTTDTQVLAMVRNATGMDLVGLSETGQERWRTKLATGSRESTLRGDVVIVRSKSGLDGYAAGTGKLIWHRPIPQDRPYIPLGFTLGQMPSIDADHLLMPTVASLEILDVTNGSSTSYRMPTDGLSSAYFPYQLLVTARHLGVVANTGAVLAARE